MLVRALSPLETPAQRRQFASLFIAQIAADEVLGPAFAVSRIASRHATATEQAWWEKALTGTCYFGQPPHRTHFPAIIATHFERWCTLLKHTFSEYFKGAGAAEAQGHVLNRAAMLAHWQLARPRRPGRMHQGSTAFQMAA